MFCTFCFCYVHLALEILSSIRKKCKINKLLTDRIKKVDRSIFCYLYMYANNAYRYFPIVFNGASKNFSTRLNSCASSCGRPETPTFFEKSHPTHTDREVHLLRSTRTHSSLKNSSPPRPSPCDSAKSPGKISGLHTSTLKHEYFSKLREKLIVWVNDNLKALKQSYS